MDTATLTADRFAKRAERTAKAAGWGDTPGALGISQAYLEHATSAVRDAKQYLKAREHGAAVAALPDDLLALAGLSAMLSAVVEGQALAHTCLRVGAAIEDEVFAYGLKTWDEKRAKDLMERVVKSHNNLKFRRTAVRSLAQKAKFPWKPWTSKERGLAGRWLAEALLETEVFCLDEDGRPAITEDAMEVAYNVIDMLQARHPVLLPVTSPPAPWKASTTLIGDYQVNLVRSHQQAVQRSAAAAVRDGRLLPAMDALNAAQSVAWSINETILDLVKWCYVEGVAVPGLPPKHDLELPQATDEELQDENRKKAFLKGRRDIRQLNRAYCGERLTLDQDVATAEHLKGAPFWTHLNFDYRGRVYGIPRFNFQRQDYVRAMFQFAEGQVLNDEGLYWLKVHVANCGDFGKISKAPFDDRVKWVDDNWLDLLDYASDPKQYLGWTEADKPFLFLAACMALDDAICCPATSRCHLPVSFDGSCSGLQHLGAMTRDDATCALVNLTPSEKPNDVYQVVADKAKAVITADLADPDLREVAQVCLDYGVNRSLVKRNVMTFSYSSKAFGMAEQHMEDTMVPLTYDVLSGKLSKHPFEVAADRFLSKATGLEMHVPGLKASKYLSKVVYEAIKQTVYRPAEAMGFLQGIAATMAHEGKPVLWHTPLGFPVLMRYPNVTTTRLRLALHDKGVQLKVEPRLSVELAGIDKRKATGAIAPSFVHSLDACHLQLVVLAAADAGVNSVALVHDSFGCLPNHAGRYREIIKQQFLDMYASNDVLFDILREAAGQLDTSWHRLPDLPGKGTYDVESVLKADYSFA